MLKYNIEEKLSGIANKDYSTKLNDLIKNLGVTKSTLHNWRHLTSKDKADIPAKKLLIIALFFECDMEDLINFELPENKSLIKKNIKPRSISKRQKIR